MKNIYFLPFIILTGCATTEQLHAQQAESARLQKQVLELQKKADTCTDVLVNLGRGYNAMVSAGHTLVEVAKPAIVSAYNTAEPIVVEASKNAYHALEPVVQQKVNDAKEWAQKTYHEQVGR
jgi:hypothetical protein